MPDSSDHGGPSAATPILDYWSQRPSHPTVRAAGPVATLLLAPGAGTHQRHPFLVSLATTLAGRGIDTSTFDFPYVVARRRRPDAPAVLEQAWRDAIRNVRARLSLGRLLFIGGRSMGGRIATQVAATGGASNLGVAGVVCLGYPYHPPGRATPRSMTHLGEVCAPILIAQGTRDVFGGPEDVRTATQGYEGVEVVAVEGADHGFSVSRRSSRSDADVLQGLADQVVAWVGRVRASGEA